MSQGFQINYLGGGRLDAPFFPTKTQPFIKGIRVEVTAGAPAAIHVHTVDRESELISIAIACSRYDDTDNWDLAINGRLIVESVYTKELPEGLFLMVAHQLMHGDKIELRYKNESARAKSVWVNYQFLTD
ncbi:Low copy number virion structural protein [Bacillus sp. FJAT-52991]|uniref:Low copy number virion structural protein n=1 Tax=Bacillus kandeliae TaxID=3129297 RepID=A0ABZ2N311_9BACI